MITYFLTQSSTMMCNANGCWMILPYPLINSVRHVLVASLSSPTPIVVVKLLLVLVDLIDVSQSIAIDNEVIGTPQIQCSENAITFSVRTRNVFRGNIYIKGQYGVPQCRQEYFSNDYPGASFSIRLGECGMRRIRQLQPHGMNYMLVFVSNFHPQFVTKIDRAYNVRCFYAQADKTVNSELEVSMINTESLEQSTMLMPNCEYTVRAGTVDGPRVRFTKIGDQLVHRWECDNPNYGMLVKNCFVNDGGGTSVRVLDARGCPVFTPVIQGNLQYDNSLNLAFVPVWAYKFPDRSQLYFQCQIQVCNKRDNECVGVTPPNCPLVTRTDYLPSSQTNPNAIPTQVIGTYGPNGPIVIPGGGIPVQSTVIDNLPDARGGIPVRPFEALYAASQREIGEEESSRRETILAPPDANVFGQLYSEEFNRQMSRYRQALAANEEDSQTAALVPARPFFSYHRNKDSPADDDEQQLENNTTTTIVDDTSSVSNRHENASYLTSSSNRQLRSPSKVDNTVAARSSSSSSSTNQQNANLKQKTNDEYTDAAAEQTTMDVISDSVYVADPELENDDNNHDELAAVASPPLSSWATTVCLHSSAMIALMCAFVLTILLMCTLISYIAYNNNRSSEKKKTNQCCVSPSSPSCLIRLSTLLLPQSSHNCSHNQSRGVTG